MGGGGGDIKETPDQVQQQKNNVQLWNYYKKSYKPYIDKFIAKETNAEKSGAQAKQAEGKVNATVMEGVGAAPPGGNAVQIAKRGNTVAAVKSEAVTGADTGVKREQLGELQNIVNIGRGQQTEALAGQGQLAEQSIQKAIADKKSELMAEGTRDNAIGSAIGAAASIGGRAAMSSSPATDYAGMAENDPNNTFTPQFRNMAPDYSDLFPNSSPNF